MIIIEVLKGTTFQSFEMVGVPRKGDQFDGGEDWSGEVKSVIWRVRNAPIVILED